MRWTCRLTDRPDSLISYTWRKYLSLFVGVTTWVTVSPSLNQLMMVWLRCDRHRFLSAAAAIANIHELLQREDFKSSASNTALALLNLVLYLCFLACCLLLSFDGLSIFLFTLLASALLSIYFLRLSKYSDPSFCTHQSVPDQALSYDFLKMCP